MIFSLKPNIMEKKQNNIECIQTRSISQWKDPSGPAPKESIAVWGENTCNQNVKFEISITRKSNNISVFKKSFILKGNEKKLILDKEKVWGSPIAFNYIITSQTYE